MIIGVPTFAVIYTLISDRINAKLAKKGYSSDNADYCEGRAKEILLEGAENDDKPKEKKKLFGFLKKRDKSAEKAVTDGKDDAPEAPDETQPPENK